ncbi:MAG: TonB-dependent receptor, partial [Candidatus Cyclobacteriaceae bacterium M3_2C_046]
MDRKTGEVLPGATVQIKDQEQGYSTGQEGKVVINESLPLTLQVSFVGYENQVIELDQPRDLAVYLEPREKMLDEIMVVGYENNRKLMETPGAVFLLEPKDIKRYDETALVRGLNTIPGVRMEQRSPGSYRISIRGSSLRSPFDVRNVKIYWNDVPFTDPNGITPLNLLDLNQMGTVEVLKGPAASIYGAGTGGVINIQSEKADFGGSSLQGGAMVGSYGLQKYTAAYQYGDENINYNLNFSHQQADGYREHTNFNRNTIQLNGQLYTSENRTISGNVFYSDLFYQVPGGLTREQYDENPKQARPDGFFPGSVTQNASVNYKYFLTSLGQRYQISDNLENQTTIYGTFSFFEMPFITDFEREARQGLGGRTRFNYQVDLGVVPTKFTAGAEYQRKTLTGRNFGNVKGVADTINFDDEVRSWQSLWFAQAELDLPSGIFLTAGLSYNNLEYDIYRLTDAILDTTYRIVKTFDPVWAPRLGLLKQLTPQLAVQGSISKGFSPPSVTEVRTGDGDLNTDLQSETGMNYEIGFRGTLFDNLISFDATYFYFKLDETIVSYTDSIINTTKFRNTGSTDQQGIEWNSTIYLVNDP